MVLALISSLLGAPLLAGAGALVGIGALWLLIIELSQLIPVVAAGAGIVTFLYLFTESLESNLFGVLPEFGSEVGQTVGYLLLSVAGGLLVYRFLLSALVAAGVVAGTLLALFVLAFAGSTVVRRLTVAAVADIVD